ncbi:MAG: hypothetical protein ACFC1C_03125 [Candidatus Malihini olakiniferum]
MRSKTANGKTTPQKYIYDAGIDYPSAHANSSCLYLMPLSIETESAIVWQGFAEPGQVLKTNPRPMPTLNAGSRGCARGFCYAVSGYAWIRVARMAILQYCVIII